VALAGRTVRGPPPGGLSEVARKQILNSYQELLRRRGSPLLGSVEMVEQIVDQANSILDAVPTVDLDRPAGVSQFIADDGGVKLSVEIGAARAIAGVPPAESLRAAVYLFEAALPVLTREFSHWGVTEPTVTASLLLQRALMDRMIVSAASYVDFLLKKVHNSHLEERHRLARDLHDRAAPAVAVGLQNLQLSEFHARTDPPLASSKLIAASEALVEALQTIRTLSAESWAAVGHNGLDCALERYLRNVPAGIRTTLVIRGDLTLLPRAYSEELFLVLREAVRNAVLHAQPANVSVELEATELALLGRVLDDGRGFDVESSRVNSGGIGLMSMRERVGLLGGILELTSSSGAGTSVLLKIPLPGVQL
jgi:signal transduction histidine kinase